MKDPFKCEGVWWLVEAKILPIRFYHVEEKQCWRVFCAQLFTSVVKNQFQVCSQIQYLSALFHLGNFFAQIFFYQLWPNFQPKKLNPAKYRKLGSVENIHLAAVHLYWMRTFIEILLPLNFAEKEKLNQSFEKVLMHEARLWASTKFRANILGENNLMKFSRRERATELVSGHLRGRAPCRRRSTSRPSSPSYLEYFPTTAIQ